MYREMIGYGTHEDLPSIRTVPLEGSGDSLMVEILNRYRPIVYLERCT